MAGRNKWARTQRARNPDGLLKHVLVPQHDGATQVQGPGVREIQWERRPHDPSANVLPKMAPYADNEPLLIQTFQDTLTGNAAEWYSQLKKISHWKELADTFLAQYGFNSQIAPDRFDLQRMEKKSNETFREYAQSSLSILIPVGERIEDALKTKKIVDMTALMALAEQAAKKAPTKKKEGDVQMIGRNNGRPRQLSQPSPCNRYNLGLFQLPAPTQAPAPGPDTPDAGKAELYPILIEKNLISPAIPRPYNGRQEEDFNQNLTCDFHFGEVYPTSPPIPLPKHPEGGVNMVEIEEGGEGAYLMETSLLYLGEAKTHHPVRSTTGTINRGMHGLVGREEIPSEGGHQPDDPSDFDWMKETTGDTSWRMTTDEWRDVDFTKLFQFPCLIVPPGFETPEFEIFYENGDPEAHLQKYGEKMALHLENELLMISVFPESLVFLERYRFNPHSILEYLGLKEDEEPYVIPDPGPKDPDSTAIAEEGEEPIKTPPPSNINTTTIAEEEYAGPMVERVEHPHHHRGGGFHHHTTDPPLPTGRRSQDVDLCAIATACLK
uniref:Retrotransposon gag domain-containing protein n=1 Tax=Fagus sylvatica TaxID=28930 RepID=A0A2N9FD07_FAGSY